MTSKEKAFAKGLKTARTKYSAPKVNNTSTPGAIFRRVSNYANEHQFGTPSVGAKPNKAGNASATDNARQRALAKGLARRTTESSRKRLTNRILAAYGQKVG